MSHWCPIHIEYEAQEKPTSECAQCWKLYDLKCPEEKGASRRMLDDYDWEST